MAKFTFGSFIYEQYRSIPPVSLVDLTGKTVVVIGANSGLGFEASEHFAKMNPGKLILGCRDSEKSRNALKRLREVTGVERAELWTIDLANFDSVKAFADRFEKEGERLDVLLENAGTLPAACWHTDDGWESSLQVNCLSPALLAILLLPHMIQTGRAYNVAPRLTIVTTDLHMLSNMDQELLHSGHFLKTYGSKEYCTKEVMQKRYNDTKLLEIYFARSLTSRLGNSTTSPIINTVNPGFCESELLRDFSSAGLIVWLSTRLSQILLARKTEVGSRTLVHAATAGEGNEDQMRGAYLSSCRIAEAGDNVVSEAGKAAGETYWAELISTLEEVDSRVQAIVAEYLSAVH